MFIRKKQKLLVHRCKMADNQPTKQRCIFDVVLIQRLQQKSCDVYRDALKINKRPLEFHNDVLKSLVKTDSKLSIQEIATTLQAT